MSVTKYYYSPTISENKIDPESQIIIDDIPPGVSEMTLRNRLSVHGNPRIEVYVPGYEYGNGWAWVSFEGKSTTQQLIQKVQSKLSERIKTSNIAMHKKTEDQEKKREETIHILQNKNELTNNLLNLSALENEKTVIDIPNVTKVNNNHTNKLNKDQNYEQDDNQSSTLCNTEDSNLDEEVSSSDFNNSLLLQHFKNEQNVEHKVKKENKKIQKNEIKVHSFLENKIFKEDKKIEIEKCKEKNVSFAPEIIQDNCLESSADESSDKCDSEPMSDF